jgi:decaprenyl-phosphate phosphoribosyltransferase
LFLQIIKLVRIYQWPKNFFIFLPLFFSGNFFKDSLLLEVCHAFFVFCLVSSFVYVVNDLIDVDSDRVHPTKKNRPIASGKIKPYFAAIIAALLLITAVLIAYNQLSKEVWILLGVYGLMNLIYSYKLKHFAILDITIIALGFIIRIAVGGITANVPLSKWLVLMTFLLSVFLALTKRRDDLILLEGGGKSARKSLDGYNLVFVNHSMIFISSIIVVSYIMYTISYEVLIRVKNDYFYVTSFFVLLGMLRYLQITFVENNSGSPSKILLTDPFTIVNLICWASTVFYFIYA